MEKDKHDKYGKIIKLGDYLKSDSFPENPLKAIIDNDYGKGLVGLVLPNEKGINGLYEENEGVEIISQKEKDEMIKKYYESDTYKTWQNKQGYGYICHHEACWGSNGKYMDTDTVWADIPEGATGCIKIKDDIL